MHGNFFVAMVFYYSYLLLKFKLYFHKKDASINYRQHPSVFYISFNYLKTKNVMHETVF